MQNKEKEIKHNTKSHQTTREQEKKEQRTTKTTRKQ